MFGNSVRAIIFGESHSESIGVEISGLPQGLVVNVDNIQALLDRRRSNSRYSTPRKEADELIIESGIIDGFTTGTLLRAVIMNTNIKSADYDNLLNTPRPSHADYVAKIKYGDSYNSTGGGAFSGRMTAPMVIMGGVAKEILKSLNIEVIAGVSNIGAIPCGDYDGLDKSTFSHDFCLINANKSGEISALLESVRLSGDSVGGEIACKAVGMPTGVGGSMWEGLESSIACGLFGIPAVKGVEFGRGFGFKELCGSVANDELYYDGDTVKTYTNNNGGINGGISNGMDITLKVAIKPTPSIGKSQRTVDLRSGKNVELVIKGRHDVCIVPRAVVVVESVVAFAILDRLVQEGRI